ncbi:tetratricopeptide repeat protein [Sinorhizobium psoraleae]|uniref:tetratricopeptide repeat protein n=1 Tax=Sinorhizobium psoraleae TaxID=520838 RepID=UPI00156A1B64|nr:tetratricopeptide repeat protein [Sinorhizobium psoraleae]
MLVSKKPRKKTAKGPKPGNDNPRPAMPDLRGMEGLMTGFFGDTRERDPVDAAQEIMYDAWETPSRSKRIALARKALTVSPLCADAYVLLAEEEAKSVQEALIWYQKGVEAGEQALGPEGFEECAGHFWGFLETRPYVRARAGLAAALWRLGRQHEALEHYQTMLELNPNDNQGIRYVLAGHLLARNDIKALKNLFKKYKEDCAAAMALYAGSSRFPGRQSRGRQNGRGSVAGQQPCTLCFVRQAAPRRLPGWLHHHGRRRRGR